LEAALMRLATISTPSGPRGVALIDGQFLELGTSVREYVAAEVPVGEHLADQLLIPMALAGGGSFLTTPLSPHSTTNMEVIGKFLARTFKIDRSSKTSHRVDVE
jgi:RNA 3'-terminal phosphate cyclase